MKGDSLMINQQKSKKDIGLVSRLEKMLAVIEMVCITAPVVCTEPWRAAGKGNLPSR